MGKQGVEFHPRITDISEIVGRAKELNDHGYKVNVTRLKDYYHHQHRTIIASDFLINYWT